MKKKFKCAEAFLIVLDLNDVFKKEDVKYPASAIIQGKRNFNHLKEELKEYMKIRDEKIMEIGVNGSLDLSDKEMMKKFYDSMEEYDNVEIEVEIATVPVEDFMKFSYSPDELIPFEFMVD